MKRTFETLDAGRGVAAVSVVLHHAAQYAALYSNGRDTASEQLFAGLALGVSYFFVLSGVVILMAHWKDLGVPARAKVYLQRRALRIYPAYWLGLLLFLVCSRRLLQVPPRFLFDILSLVRTTKYSYIAFPVSWTLFHEILFYALFLTLILNRRIGLVLMGAWCVLAALSWRPGLLPFGNFISSVQLLFGLGMLGERLLHHRRGLRFPGWMMAAGGTMMTAVVIQSARPGFISQTGYLVGGIGSLLVLLGLAELELRNRIRVPAFLRLLGKASYALYLVHLATMALLAGALSRLGHSGPIPFYPRMILLFATGLASGLAFHLWLEVPLMAWLRPLSGPGRQKTS